MFDLEKSKDFTFFCPLDGCYRTYCFVRYQKRHKIWFGVLLILGLIQAILLFAMANVCCDGGNFVSICLAAAVAPICIKLPLTLVKRGQLDEQCHCIDYDKYMTLDWDDYIKYQEELEASLRAEYTEAKKSEEGMRKFEKKIRAKWDRIAYGPGYDKESYKRLKEKRLKENNNN